MGRVLWPSDQVVESPRVARLARRPVVDVPTLALLVLLWAGLIVAYEGHRRRWLPALAAIAVGLLAMNLSFTVWHEGVHQNFARSKRFNHWLARLGAVPVFIPYPRLRVHHLLHHRFTNDPERDPDYWQVQGAFWSVGLRYLHGERESRRITSRTMGAATNNLGDWLQIGVTLAALAALAWLSPWSVLFAFVIPRALLVYVHTLYVNYLPHAWLPSGRYVSSRFLPVRVLLSTLMVQHNYHALHHAYVSIPWHRYARAHRLFSDDLARRGVSTLRRGETWLLLRGTRNAP
jgi:fatty acid desaturase